MVTELHSILYLSHIENLIRLLQWFVNLELITIDILENEGKSAVIFLSETSVIHYTTFKQKF